MHSFGLWLLLFFQPIYFDCLVALCIFFSDKCLMFVFVSASVVAVQVKRQPQPIANDTGKPGNKTVTITM